MALYDDDRNIQDVLEFLYRNDQRKLADAVVQLIKSNEQPNDVICNCKCRVNAIGLPYTPNPMNPNTTYC